MNSAQGFSLSSYTSDGWDALEVITSYPGSITGFGVCMNRGQSFDEMFDGESTDFTDGQQIYILSEEVSGMVTNLFLFKVDWDGSIVTNKATVSTTRAKGLCTDGRAIYIWAEGPAPALNKTIRQVLINPNGYRAIDAQITSTVVLDLCFDGRAFWMLDSTNVAMHDPSDWVNPVETFAHGISSPLGLTTDGQNLWVVN